VDVVERQVPPDVANVVSERQQQLADSHLGLAAVRAFVVATLDQRDRRLARAANVIAFEIDVVGQLDEVVRRAAELASSRGGGQASAARGTSAPVP
jgi:hypothetical protein